MVTCDNPWATHCQPSHYPPRLLLPNGAGYVGDGHRGKPGLSKREGVSTRCPKDDVQADHTNPMSPRSAFACRSGFSRIEMPIDWFKMHEIFHKEASRSIQSDACAR